MTYPSNSGQANAVNEPCVPKKYSIGDRVISDYREAVVIALAEGEHVKVRYDSRFLRSEWQMAYRIHRILEEEA